jgi:hypothetical protein
MLLLLQMAKHLLLLLLLLQMAKHVQRMKPCQWCLLELTPIGQMQMLVLTVMHTRLLPLVRLLLRQAWAPA